MDVAMVGGMWSGLAMAREITTRSELNVVVLEIGGAAILVTSSQNIEGVVRGRDRDDNGYTVTIHVTERSK